MNRRTLIKTLCAALLAGQLPEAVARAAAAAVPRRGDLNDASLKDYLHKMRNFDRPHKDDIHLEARLVPVMNSTTGRLRRVEEVVGYGNFHLLGFDEMLKVGQDNSYVGAFRREETEFLDMLFHRDAADYGFVDVKPLPKLTDAINTKYIEKVPESGHFLYRGRPVRMYQQIRRELGDKVILTSGIRSIVKQFLLFLDKAQRNDGNLSLASRSLAPPGYSFHSVGDFDVGQVNFGAANFTEQFTSTPVYRDLLERGYATLRYEKDNRLGVRFEPWHIKLNRHALA